MAKRDNHDRLYERPLPGSLVQMVVVRQVHPLWRTLQSLTAYMAVPGNEALAFRRSARGDGTRLEWYDGGWPLMNPAKDTTQLAFEPCLKVERLVQPLDDADVYNLYGVRSTTTGTAGLYLIGDLSTTSVTGQELQLRAWSRKDRKELGRVGLNGRGPRLLKATLPRPQLSKLDQQLDPIESMLVEESPSVTLVQSDAQVTGLALTPRPGMRSSKTITMDGAFGIGATGRSLKGTRMLEVVKCGRHQFLITMHGPISPIQALGVFVAHYHCGRRPRRPG